MKEFEKNIIELRRDLHKYPEVKWTEFRTSSIVYKTLEKLGYEVYVGDEIVTKGFQFGYPSELEIEKEIARAIKQGGDKEIINKMNKITGVLGVLDTGKPGPVIGFRFDMDALTIMETGEENHKPNKDGFRSINDGYFHACGHDGHVAIGLGVAEKLIEIKEDLCGKIKLIFQPSEEGGGGAKGIVEKGVLDDVEYFFAGHIGLTKLDGIPLGSNEIICGVKDFLDNRRYDVTYIGKAAHPCGDPHKGRNALLAASTAAVNIHSIAPHSEGMLRVNVGTLKAGNSRNSIPSEAFMQIEARGENDIVAEYGESKVISVIKGAAEIYQVDYDINNIGNTSSAKSDDKAIELVYKVAKNIKWVKKIHKIGSVGGSDDASEMIRRVQKNGGIGTYIGLGADFSSSFHNSSFDFDESVLIPSVDLFVNLVKEINLKNKK